MSTCSGAMTVREVPLVLEQPPSIVAVDDVSEAVALRSVLECFNYRVEIHRVGSRRQLVEILRGAIPTHRCVVLSGHGDGEGILVPNEPKLTPPELREIANLRGRILLSLCCGMAREEFAEAFLSGGCTAYIASIGEVNGNSALLFAIHLFYFLARDVPLVRAVEESRKHDQECALFKVYQHGGAQGGVAVS